ncbi:TetR/AcrR family transcriptional regulator [Streptacidiphilus sp. P02-A3a]|uniref:TetR/AcrR family transcriptional regulator n=1 Tax=Streptacidiphilus sp. P02-A3a TaxID=2704468 RepID=UPI001CDD67C2|nr:TetR/AcrR family transcriptional regulator [Streptacidiphilus sp. P02-A3a]
MASAPVPSPGSSPTPQPPARRGRGRRPADEVRADILAAAGTLLLGEGMAAFTIERVAATAGVSKMSIYKWWPSKGALALDGYFDAVQNILAFPDTGDIEADLLTQLRAFVHLTAHTPAGRVVAELVGQAQTDPDLAAAFREHYSAPRRRLAVQALERAQQRGQLRADADPRIIVDQLWGACYHRLLIPDEPLTEEFAHGLVTNLINGLRP